MISENAKYWIALSLTVGFNNPKIKRLLKIYPDIKDFFRDVEKESRLCGVFHSMELEKLKSIDLNAADSVIRKCGLLDYSVISIDDENYPESLYHIYAPPAVIYVWGELPDIENSLSIGVVGTRRASVYGLENSYKIGYSLAKYGAVIVSGGALGVDCASHRGALAANGVTVCVRGCGINYPYLADNAEMRRNITKRGAVISEYPPDTPPLGYHFPARNRIISALSDGIVLIEAGEKSGSLITANLAIEMGKDIFALLGNNNSQNRGSNLRIKEGTALPITDFMDILAHYDNSNYSFSDFEPDEFSLKDISSIPVKGKKTRQAPPAEIMNEVPREIKQEPKKSKHKKVELEGDAKLIYEYLSDSPVHIDTIAGDLGLPVSALLSSMTELEIRGLIRRLRGSKYALNN